MSKSLSFRLFGLGAIPKKARPILESEEILVSDEGMKGRFVAKNVKGPGKRYIRKIEGFSGCLLITKKRIVCYSYGKRQIHIAADDPKLSILIIIDEPQGISYGGTVAAPIFKKAAYQIIDYLHITPPKMVKTPTAPSTMVGNTFDTADLFKRVSANSPASVPTIPDFSGLSMREVKDLAEKHNLSVKLIGSGVACEQYPSPGVPIEHDRSCQITFQPLS